MSFFMRRLLFPVLFVVAALVGVAVWRGAGRVEAVAEPVPEVAVTPTEGVVERVVGGGAVNGGAGLVPAGADGRGGRGHFDGRAVIAAGWVNADWPEQVAFRGWVAGYGAATERERARMVADGVVLAGARRAALKALIVADPEQALAAAVPLAVRAGLPAEVEALLEKRVSGEGELALNAVTPLPGGVRPAQAEFRSALVGGVEYRAHVYGERAKQLTVPVAVLAGIAVDKELAVAESPVRVLEPGEVPLPVAVGGTVCPDCAARALAQAGRAAAGEVAYEYAGRVGVAADAGHFAADASALEAGERGATAADNQPGTSTVSGRPSQAWTHGNKTVLVIRVDFSDLTGEPVSDGQAVTETRVVDLFTTGGLEAFYAASSFGKVSLSIAPAVGGNSPDVTQVLRMPRTASTYATNGDDFLLHADARAVAKQAGYAVENFDRVGVVFSSLATLPGSKITYGGLANVLGKNFWVNGAYSFRVVAHELGHTFGLRHANLWEVTDGNPVSEAGTSIEYGDPFDIMGGGELFSSTDDFSAWNKSLLQWIPDAAVTVADGSGTYRVHRFDAAAANLALPRALKVVRDPVRDYWIGYRRATDNASLDGGAYVMWGYNNNQTSSLLDLTTPGSDPEDAGLALGVAFNDAAAGITLKPVAQGGEGADEWLDVQVTFESRVQWLSASVIASEKGGEVDLVLRRTGKASGAISVAYATEPGTGASVATATVDYASSSGTVSWADGDMADKTVTIPLVADSLVEGTEDFRVRLGVVTGGVKVGEAAAVVTIADAGARDTSFTADFINSSVQTVLPLPDGRLVLGGFFTQAQSGGVSSLLTGLLRMSSTGVFDRAFDPSGSATMRVVRQLALQPDGRILVAGDVRISDEVTHGLVVRIESDGALDLSFNDGAGANGRVRAMLLLPDGRLLLGGDFTSFNGVAREYLVRLMPDGSVDTTFTGPNFGESGGWRVETLAMQGDGKILVGGLFYFSGSPFRSGLCRIQPNGAVDTSFSGLLAGSHAAGKTSTITAVRSIAVRPDGKILVAGDFTGFNGVLRRRLAQLTATGELDPDFSAEAVFGAPYVVGGENNESVNAVVLQPDGLVLVGGTFNSVGGLSISRLARLGVNGELDEDFSAGGSPGGTVLDLAMLPDGRLCLVGAVATYQSDEENRHPVWRVLPGVEDSTGVVDFSADAYSGIEGGTCTLVVRRSGGALGAIRVGYAAAVSNSADTATSGADYVLASGVLEWADGDTSPKTITVALAADAVADDGETFTVRIGEPVIGGDFLGERREAVVTISPTELQPQAITFAELEDRGFTLAPIALAATAGSGLDVSFEIVSGPATLSGGSLILTGLGEVTVRANQAGNAAFSPANPVERSFTVTQGTQTITFARPANRTLEAGAFALAASADSGLVVGFELVSGSATLSGATLTPTALGEVTVRAVQAGNANFAAAAAVERTFKITTAATISLGGLAQTYADAPREVTVETTPPGLAYSLTYDGSTTPPREAGSYAVVATILDEAFSGEAIGTLVVAKAPLLVKGPTVAVLFKATVPALALEYVGFAGNDTAADLDQVPTFASTASNKSKLGAYPVTVSGGADDNYVLTLQNGLVNVVTIAGAYETLLFAGDEPGAIGLVRVTVASDLKKFTGVLEWADETAKLTIRGTVASATGRPEDVTGEGSLVRVVKGGTNYTYRLVVRPGAIFEAELYRDGALVGEGTGVALLPAADKTRGAFAGAYTLRLAEFAPMAEADERELPTGSGLATATVAKNGPLVISGALPDGKKLTGTLAVSATRAGDYLMFARPYGARAQSYVAGRVQTRRAGETAPTADEPGVPLVWRKGVKPATVKTELFAGGFAVAGVSELRRWTAPSNAVPLATLLGLDVADAGVLAVEYAGAELGGSSAALPVAVALDARGLVSVGGANASKWNLKITPTKGSFAGSFILSDSVIVPGKSGKSDTTKIVKRTVKFSGVLRQPDANATEESEEARELVGEANYLVPALVKGGEVPNGSLKLSKPPEVP